MLWNHRMAHVLIGEPVATSPEHAQICAENGPCSPRKQGERRRGGAPTSPLPLPGWIVAGSCGNVGFAMGTLSISLADIEAARRTIAGHVLRTPMLPAPRLSALTGAHVHVKYENLQVTNSFKERGALAKLASLTAAERAHGVIAMSAGNHAQAVAYHAARLGIPATIVMPETTPYVKVAATKAYGAEVVLDGEGISE